MTIILITHACKHIHTFPNARSCLFTGFKRFNEGVKEQLKLEGLKLISILPGFEELCLLSWF